MTSPGSIVVMCAGGGHLQRMLPLVACLVQRGAVVHVLTRAEGRVPVEAAGARWHGLFDRFPVEAVDRESIPLPSRFVTFAAAYAEDVTRFVEQLRPRLILYDSFVVVAPIVARRLDVPYAGLRSGHAQVPDRAVEEIAHVPWVRTSAACHQAATVLRERDGIEDADPFLYLRGLSPYLNLYPEPPQFLDASDAEAFAPIAFVGSLDPGARERASTDRPLARHDRRRRVYVSFATVIWRYYADVALDALAVIAAACPANSTEVLVSLGHHSVDDRALALIRRPNVQVAPFVDQWGALKDADLFVTHHGLNSTHEAIFHRVPMLSYPFFGDQPALARCCERLGLARPIARAPRAAVDAPMVTMAMESVVQAGEQFATALATARRWELETIDGRGPVFDRLLAL